MTMMETNHAHIGPYIQLYVHSDCLYIVGIGQTATKIDKIYVAVCLDTIITL